MLTRVRQHVFQLLEGGLADQSSCIELQLNDQNGLIFERCLDFPIIRDDDTEVIKPILWRVFLASDDYDFVELESTISFLEAEASRLGVS